MSDTTGKIPGRVSELRMAFDQVFAAPLQSSVEEIENILAIRIKGDRLALDVREIAAVESAGPIVPLPSRSPGILGIAGIRGGLVPVYSLAALLGYASDRETSRWLALTRTPDALALSIGDLEGYWRVPRRDVHEPQGESRKHIPRLAQVAQTVRGIVSIPSVVAAIKEAAGEKR